MCGHLWTCGGGLLQPCGLFGLGVEDSKNGVRRSSNLTSQVWGAMLRCGLGSSAAQSQCWVWLKAKGIQASPKLPPVLPALSPSKSLGDFFDRALGEPQAREVPGL